MTVVIDGTTGIDTGTGSLIAANASTPTYVRLFEDTDNGSNYVDLIAPTSVAANRTITLPDGTGTVVVNNVSSALVSGTAQTASGINVDFANVIPSWAKRITVMFNGISVTANTVPGFVQLGTGTTPTYTTSGYVAVGSQLGASAIASSNQTSGFPILNQFSATATMQGLITISNLTGNTWAAFGCTAENGSGRQFLSSGAVTLGAALTSIRVNHGDTFDAGTINIMWE